MALVLLFAAAVPVSTWLDLAAFGFALTVFTGIHTFPTLLREAFPVNHFAEVAATALLAISIAQRRPRLLAEVSILLLLSGMLLLVESAVLIWVILVACAALRMPGVRPRAAVAATLVLIAYVGARQYFEVGSPGIGAHGSGYGASFLSGDELRERFGSRPLPFMAYNVTGGALSVVFSEPRFGVYSILTANDPDGLSPVVPINIGSSLLVTSLIAWFARRVWRRGWRTWDMNDRLVVVAGVVLAASAALCLAYVKDDILSVAGAAYALAAYVAARALLGELATVSAPRALSVVVVPLFFLIATPLWTFRTLGAHYDLRHVAFITRNDWVQVSAPGGSNERRSGSAALTRALRDEAISRRVSGQWFLPRWGDRYWVE